MLARASAAPLSSPPPQLRIIRIVNEVFQYILTYKFRKNTEDLLLFSSAFFLGTKLKAIENVEQPSVF